MKMRATIRLQDRYGDWLSGPGSFIITADDENSLVSKAATIANKQPFQLTIEEPGRSARIIEVFDNKA